MESLSGKLLVAAPQLRDPNFVQTVVLIIQHEPQGALGVILNRPSQQSVREVCEILDHQPCSSDRPIYSGGPVPGPLLAVHTASSHADQEILPGLFVSAKESSFHNLLDNEQDHWRIYSGHAGWGEGQLDGELRAGGWLTTDAVIEDIFSDYQTLWKRMTSRIGLNILVPGLRPDQVPKDPGLN
ncbi:MAG: YqgE/AlgH family protein [Planctomycetales bacterium]|nr:YqgE/AlgH family protein [Planctomycetales bacterium]